MRVRAIAINTFREAVQDKVLYTLLAFALVVIVGSLLVGSLTLGEEVKIIKDMGLAAISLFGTLIAIFVGVGLVYREIDKKTIYTILSKPIHRYEFLLGKFLGLVLTLFVELAVMTGGLLVLLAVYEGGIDLGLLKGVLLLFFELLVVIAIALLFSSFSTPILSGIFTLALYVIGHLLRELRLIGGGAASDAARWLVRAAYYLLPDLETFNVRAEVAHGEPVPWGYVAWAVVYGLVYLAAVLFLTSFIFSRRDFL